jgi:hypothetical protein
MKEKPERLRDGQRIWRLCPNLRHYPGIFGGGGGLMKTITTVRTVDTLAQIRTAQLPNAGLKRNRL